METDITVDFLFPMIQYVYLSRKNLLRNLIPHITHTNPTKSPAISKVTKVTTRFWKKVNLVDHSSA
jgi:hypothetical protein